MCIGSRDRVLRHMCNDHTWELRMLSWRSYKLANTTCQAPPRHCLAWAPACVTERLTAWSPPSGARRRRCRRSAARSPAIRAASGTRCTPRRCGSSSPGPPAPAHIGEQNIVTQHRRLCCRPHGTAVATAVDPCGSTAVDLPFAPAQAMLFSCAATHLKLQDGLHAATCLEQPLKAGFTVCQPIRRRGRAVHDLLSSRP